MTLIDAHSDRILFEHRGGQYELNRLAEGQWSIRSLDGRAFGTLQVISPEGEEHLPVYGGFLPGETDTLSEGSDWDGIVRDVINNGLDR
jgi:hypothetical protein